MLNIVFNERTTVPEVPMLTSEPRSSRVPPPTHVHVWLLYETALVLLRISRSVSFHPVVCN